MPLIAIFICGFMLGFFCKPAVTAIVLACIWLVLMVCEIRAKRNGTMP